MRILHLDHQTRDGQSAEDAQFVQELARAHQVPCSVALRSDIEALADKWPANRSARFRALRLRWFGSICREYGLRGVILAHHADDQAETILQRLLRGASMGGLAGMAPRSTVGGLTLLRPLLELRRIDLRRFLERINQPWREDSSNALPVAQRNRVRMLLQGQDELVQSLLDMGEAARQLQEWVNSKAPSLESHFAGGALSGAPSIVRNHAIRAWLAARGCPVNDVSQDLVERVVRMATDAAAPARLSIPGRITLRRTRGVLRAQADDSKHPLRRNQADAETDDSPHDG